MDDEWHALEHYLLTRTGRARGAGTEAPEPSVAPIATVDPDDPPAPSDAPREVRPARG
jgi:hypothetical protein